MLGECLCSRAFQPVSLCHRLSHWKPSKLLRFSNYPSGDKIYGSLRNGRVPGGVNRLSFYDLALADPDEGTEAQPSPGLRCPFCLKHPHPALPPPHSHGTSAPPASQAPLTVMVAGSSVTFSASPLFPQSLDQCLACTRGSVNTRRIISRFRCLGACIFCYTLAL